MGGIPQKYKDLVGTEQIFSGGLFSSKKSEPEAKYNVLDIRWGSAKIVNAKEIRAGRQSSYEYPTVEYLIKNSSMKRSRWTRGFPVKEINLVETN